MRKLFNKLKTIGFDIENQIYTNLLEDNNIEEIEYFHIRRNKVFYNFYPDINQLTIFDANESNTFIFDNSKIEEYFLKKYNNEFRKIKIKKLLK